MIWRRPELRILLVCTANVCRSPLAQALLQHRLRVAGLARRVSVTSAGTRVASPGRRPDPRVQRLLREAGVPLGRIRARQLTRQLLARQDLVLVMEAGQLHEVEALALPGTAPAELQLLGAFLSSDIPVESIPDPYFSDWQGFLAVRARIDQALDGLMDWLPARLGSPPGR